MATLVIFANAVGLMLFLQGRTEQLLRAVVDPMHPDWMGMERAFAGFTLYAMSLFAVLATALVLLIAAIVRRARSGNAAARRRWTHILPHAALAGGLTAIVVLVFIEVLVFQDYGVHFYEFDVFGILANAALRRDLGIQPAEVARVTAAAMALLGAEIVLCALAARMASWRDGALARACGAAMLIGVPGGLVLFRASEEAIGADRAEFAGALPLGRQLLFRETTRPHIPVRPRLGRAGYAIIDSASPAPAMSVKKNIFFFVADGLRGDMVRPELTPNLLQFGARDDVIRSRRHLSTGHVSEAGIFGLLYGIHAHAYNSFIEKRVPAYPVEVLKHNGYHTLLLSSSRLNPYPTDQLIRMFDEVSYPANDDEALSVLERYLKARATDGKPYFVLAFLYTPHYPFTSAKPHLRKYPLVGPSSRTNYMNDVLQADEYFQQAFDLLRNDFERGTTVVLATSDHGEEIREHGVFGHASATFWNEKIVVPLFLGLPGAELSIEVRRPAMTSHVDVWPTVFEYLQMTPRLAAVGHYSDGRSLLESPRAAHSTYVAGRFFPYADRPSVLVDSARKYWFRVTGVDSTTRLCIQITRVTDLDDRKVSAEASTVDPSAIPAFGELQSRFWRFIEHTGRARGACRTEQRVGP